MTTSETNDMRCTVCKQQKHTLRPRKSKLISGLQMYLCDGCFVGKKEPRFAIILHARSDGAASVADYVKNHRYVGDPILLTDLVI